MAALAWANLAPSAYDSAWETPLTIRLGDLGLTLTVREWVNSGLMTFFFFVVGLEARRKFPTLASCDSDAGPRSRCWRA